MHALPQGLRRAVVRAAAFTAGPAGLAGCDAAAAAGPEGAAAWGFISLALVLVGAVAYGMGSTRARLVHERSLREARGQLRQLAQLQSGWLWHTDANHRLLSWRHSEQPVQQACALFDGADATAGANGVHGALAQCLQARQPFDALRLHAAKPQNGHFGWQLRGLPCHDDLGRFSGFAGTATPTDDSDAAQAATAAVPALLAAWPAPAVVAVDGSSGWRVQHFNTAALVQWPGLSAGDVLADRLPTLPADVAAAVQGRPATDAGAALAGGWQVLPFDAAAAGRGLVLAQQPGAAAAGPDATVQAGEGDSFSFTVSHDLRAPIRVVEGFTRIVKEDYGRLLDRVGNDHLDRVLGAAARMNLMIDALLTLARLSAQPLARQPVNLSQLAAYVVDDLRRSAPERDADIDIQPALTAQGDPTLLRLVLENLLGNAWKYSARSHRTQMSLRAEPHGPRTAFVVRDNGAGFDMRSADRLFGLFQRLHSASEFPGHGVGLASVRRIVRRHGGDIWAEAEPGRGAAFFFTLS